MRLNLSLRRLAADCVQVAILRLILLPAVYLLPRRGALSVAQFSAWILLLLPSVGSREYRQLRAAFGKGRWATVALAHQRLGWTFRRFVMCKRVLLGREQPTDWRIVEKHAGPVDDIRKSGRSYILVTGHFDGEAMVGALKSPSVAPGRVVQVADPLPPRAQSLEQWWQRLRREGFVRSMELYRRRVQAQPFFDALARSWDRPVEYLFARNATTGALTLYRRLKESGTVVYMAIDMARHQCSTGYIQRGFAGRAPQYYSTGAAQLAKDTGCPILICTCRLAGSGDFVVEWGQPVLHVGDVADTTNSLLEFLEKSVGAYPGHFTDEIGGARRWDTDRGQWM